MTATCLISWVLVVSLGHLAIFTPTDIGTMNDDNTTTAVRPDAGAGTLVFGLPAGSDAIARLNFAGLMHQADCRSLSRVQITFVARAVCTLFPTPNDRDNDAVSVIDGLCQFGFEGELWVLAPPLLRPKMVESELRALSKGMSLRLLAGHLPPLTDI